MIVPFVRSFLVAAVVVASAAPSAHAQPYPASPPPPPPTPVPDEPRVALTFSPIHLVIPMLEVSAEIRVMPRLGIGVIAGAGATRIRQTNELIKLAEAGLSPRYYVWGSFRRGIQIGAELLYLHAIGDDFTGATISAAGLSLGPYVGYKWTHRSGFTFEAQGGVVYFVIEGEGQASSTSRSDVSPLLNLQVGWSF